MTMPEGYAEIDRTGGDKAALCRRCGLAVAIRFAHAHVREHAAMDDLRRMLEQVANEPRP